jgi:thymidine phosphorylase
MPIARQVLESGKAFEKFKAICEKQGRYTEPGEYAACRQDVLAAGTGVITSVDNRKLAKIAKLAGAPNDPAAGLMFFAHLDKQVDKGQVLYTVYAQTPGQLSYALEYAQQQNNIIKIQQYGEGLD